MSDRNAPLTPTDRAVIESIRRGAHDAEIAARLGISIGDVKKRIERLQERFGRSERSGLATVDLDREARDLLDASVPNEPGPAPAPEPGEDESSIELPPERPDGPSIDPSVFEATEDEPTHSRRAVLGMIGIGAAAVAGAGMYYLSGGGSGPSRTGPDPFATNTPTPAPSPTPTPTPHPGTAVIQPDPDAWSRHTFPNDADLDLEHGIGFIDTETGETEFFQALAGGGNPARFGQHRYDAGPGNDVIVLRSGQDSTQALYRRSTGDSYSWDGFTLDLVGFTDDVLVFHRVNSPQTSGGTRGRTGIFDILDSSLESLGRFELPVADNVQGWAPAVVFSRNDEAIAISSGTTDVYFVDPYSGRSTRFEAPEVDDGQRGPLSVVQGDEPDTFFVRTYWMSDPEEGPMVHEFIVGADGELRGRREEHGLAPGQPRFWSPDGRYRLVPGSLRMGHIPLRDGENWVYMDLVTADTGESLFRVLSGNPWHSRPVGRRWLADSSAFVVESQDTSPAVDSYEAWRRSRRYYLVSVDGEPELLPRPPFNGDDWEMHRYGAPEPSPDNADLLCFGSSRVWNRSTDSWLGPHLRAAPMHIEPWGESSREVRFAIPLDSTGWGGVGTVLSPLVEEPPYRDGVALAVARTGNCVNVRIEPTLESDVLACLPDDTEVVVVDPEVLPGIPAAVEGETTAFYGEPTDEPEQMFVHVRTQGGLTGWVAIQYLDWAV